MIFKFIEDVIHGVRFDSLGFNTIGIVRTEISRGWISAYIKTYVDLKNFNDLKKIDSMKSYKK